jgi:proteasome accessory factor C
VVDRDRIDSLTARLASVAGDALAEVGDAVRIGGFDALATEVLATVEEALSTGRRLNLRYLVPSRDEITTRQVDPIRLVLIDGHRYLVAWCHRAQAHRQFRLDRIESAAVSELAVGEHPEPPEVGARPAYASGSDHVQAVLHLAPQARWIAEYAVVEALSEEPDGSTTVTLSTASLPWLARLVVRAAGAATVIGPEELTRLVVELATDGLNAQTAITAGS